MRERPIMFKGEMVRAILAGRKTQTRRIIKPQPTGAPVSLEHWACPYGAPGDRLWVREAWMADPLGSRGRGQVANYPVLYRVGFGDLWPEMAALVTPRWKSPIFMPRWASRITLEITDVRVQRLQDITTEDATAEGVFSTTMSNGIQWSSASAAFQSLWDSINRKTHPWASNPWVWALTFKREEVACG